MQSAVGTVAQAIGVPFAGVNVVPAHPAFVNEPPPVTVVWEMMLLIGEPVPRDA